MSKSVLYLYSSMDKSSQILLFLIILVVLMLICIGIINIITKKKNESIVGLNKSRSKINIKPTVNMNKTKVQSVSPSNKVVDNYKKNVKEVEEEIEEIEELDIDVTPKDVVNEIKEQVMEEVKENPLKKESVEEIVKVSKSSIDDITDRLENTGPNKPIDLTRFEIDQEENAIISYDELVKRAGAKKIVYRCEEKKENVIKVEEPKKEIKVEPKKEQSGKFKASRVISPIFGVQKEAKTKDEVMDSFLEIEKYKKTSNEENDSEFLSSLKEFRSTLE